MSGDTFENVNVVANKTIRQDVDDTTRPVEISGIKVGKTEYKHRATTGGSRDKSPKLSHGLLSFYTDGSACLRISSAFYCRKVPRYCLS